MTLVTILQLRETTRQPVHVVWWVEEGTKKKKLLSLLTDGTFYRLV